MARTDGFLLSGRVDNAPDGIPALIAVIDASNDSRYAEVPFSVQDGNYVLDLDDAAIANWPDSAKFQLEVDVSSITGVAGEKKIRLVEIDSKQVFSKITTAPSLAIWGTTLAGPVSAVTITDPNPVTGRRYDIWVDGVDRGTSIVYPDTVFTLDTPIPADGQNHTVLLRYWDNDDLSTLVDISGTVTAAASSTSDVVNLVIPSAADTNISDAEFTSFIQGTNVSRHYVAGEGDLEIVQSNGQWWLQAEHLPAANGSNQIGAFHNLDGIDPTQSFSIEQIVEFDANWTHGDVFIVEKLGFGVQGRDDSDNYVTGGSTSRTGWSARFEVYGPNGPGSGFTPNTATLGAYIYWAGWNDTGDFKARHVETDMVVSAGNTYRMRMDITPNTPNNTDGAVTITAEQLNASGAVVDTKTGTKSGFAWRDGTFNFDGVSFDSFFGGNNSDYSPAGLANIRFRGMKVTQ